MGYVYYTDDVAHAYRVDPASGQCELFHYGMLAWKSMGDDETKGMGRLMVLISNGDAQLTSERDAMRTVEVIRGFKARRDAGDTTPRVFLEDEVAAEVDARNRQTA